MKLRDQDGNTPPQGGYHRWFMYFQMLLVNQSYPYTLEQNSVWTFLKVHIRLNKNSASIFSPMSEDVEEVKMAWSIQKVLYVYDFFNFAKGQLISKKQIGKP